MNTRMTMLILAAATMAATACDEAEPAGTGTLAVGAWGEDYIEVEIPASETVDGWAVTFDTFLVAVSDVSADFDGQSRALDGAWVVDLAAASGGAGHALGELAVPAGHNHLSFTVGPAVDGATLVNATATDAAAMVAAGASVWVEGTATKGSETKIFQWAFTTTTAYSQCHIANLVPADGKATTLLTIHADHVFYDSLVSDTPGVAFELIASADTDADGVITQDELKAVDITTEAKYQVGNQTDVTDLWAYMAAQTRTLGHIDGEGHCETVN